MHIETKLSGFTLRVATEQDVPLILHFIKELAEYEKLAHEVTADETILAESLFKRKAAEVIIGEYQDEPVAFALFFHNFSTFLGKPGLYLEDLYVKPVFRKQGMGKIMLSFLGKLALDRSCGRFEWACLNWNTPAIDFYKKQGAEPMNDWKVYRLTGEALENFASEF